ncbi:hypothetical protein CPB85DRAFT_1252695 [Mucidula mucida]|nr:hypothetical protein CPB85DRAFT_1252695 [Mucidula mucida]
MPRTKSRFLRSQNDTGQYSALSSTQSIPSESVPPFPSQAWSDFDVNMGSVHKDELKPMLDDSDNGYSANSNSFDSDDEWEALTQISALPHDERRYRRQQTAKAGGAKSMAGKKWGPYKVGGNAERTARRKCQKIREEYGNVNDLTNGKREELERCLTQTTQKSAPTQKDGKLTAFFQPKPQRQPSPVPNLVDISNSDNNIMPVSPARTTAAQAVPTPVMPEPPLAMEEEELSDKASDGPEQEAVNASVEVTEAITEWTEDMLND